MAPGDAGDAAVVDIGDGEEPFEDLEELERAIAALTAVEDRVQSLVEGFDSLETGLSRSDTVALLYGRRNGLNKGNVKDAMSTLESMGGRSDTDLVKRLLADLSDLNKSEAQDFVDELTDLRRKYGSDD